MSKNCPAGRPPTAEAHSADRAAQINISALKRQAAGHWREILSTFGGLPLEILNGKNHPCPIRRHGSVPVHKIGGRRFNLLQSVQPELRRRHSVAAMADGDTFPDTIKRLAAHLGVNGNGNHSKRQVEDRSHL